MSVKFEAMFWFRSKVDLVVSADVKQLSQIERIVHTFDLLSCLRRQGADGVDRLVVNAQRLFTFIQWKFCLQCQ